MNTGQLKSCEEEKKVIACGVISRDEAFFQDHFPAFPVLPGVLMIEILRCAAEKFFQQKKSGAKYRLKEVASVRYSHFLKPGEAWEARLEMLSGDETNSDWKGQLFKEERPICTAKFKLEAK